MHGFELLLMRHGQAEDYGTHGDADRALTPHGEETARLVGETLARLGLDWNAAVSSPFRRAEQTLKLVLEANGLVGEAPPTDAMFVPGAAPTETIATLVAFARSCREGAAIPRVLAVGHNPNITATLGMLVVGDPGVHFSVATADVAHLWVDLAQQPPRAAVLGFYPSKALRELAGQ